MKIKIRRQCVVGGVPRMVGDELDLDEKLATELVQIRRALPVDPPAEAVADTAATEEVVEQATKPRRSRKSE